jgi:glycerophosphoryl diester phosphodiesterase
MKKPLFIAHRAGGKGVYENKIETIKRILKNSLVDAVEVDVRKTKDGVLVLNHNRGVNLNGKRFWVDKVSYDQIKHLGIPTLEEVLCLFKDGKKILNLDIKEKNIIGDIIKLLKKNNYSQKIYFDSPHLETLFAIQEEMPNGEYFLSTSPDDSRDFGERRIIRIIALLLSILLSRLAIFILKKKLRRIKLDGISLFYRWATASFIKDLHDFGFKVFVWGTDDKKTIEKLLNLGIDGVKAKEITVFEKLSSKTARFPR